MDLSNINILGPNQATVNSFETLKENYLKQPYLPIKWRKLQLKQLKKMITENQESLCEAVSRDLNKPEIETIMMEIGIVLKELKLALRKLKSWTKAKYQTLPYALWPAVAKNFPEPLGVVLIISPWNYPLLLTLQPLIGAIAAGNRIAIKMSRKSQNTSKLIQELLPKYLDTENIKNFSDIAGSKLTDFPFDKIFFTGSLESGKAIMKTASKHLTPLTLELGGKNPCYVDDSVNLEAVAKRIVWGKFINAGQTCVAPDYILVEAGSKARLIEALKEKIQEMFPLELKEYYKMIDQNEFNRVLKYLKNGKIEFGGGYLKDLNIIQPTIISEISLKDPIMQEEIFGPILPIISVKNVSQALEIINSRPRPLVLYAFSKNKIFTKATSSGALNYKVPLAHLYASKLPFGGIGWSGMGQYHGKFTFDCFSHLKPILSKPLTLDTFNLVYPPYTKLKIFFGRFISK